MKCTSFPQTKPAPSAPSYPLQLPQLHIWCYISLPFSNLSLHAQPTPLITPSAKVGSGTPLKHGTAPSLPLTFIFFCFLSTCWTPPHLLQLNFTYQTGWASSLSEIWLTSSHLQQTMGFQERSYYIISASFLQVVSISAAKNTVHVKRQQN